MGVFRREIIGPIVCNLSIEFLGGEAMKIFRLLLTVITSVCVAESISAETLEEGQTGYVYYESGGGDVTLNGKILLPDSFEARVPAIILVHGSGGIGHREAEWGELFRDNGYATMVIDMFGPRNFTAMSGRNVGSAQDIFDAFNVLIKHPNIDPDQISVMGWSWGANLTVSSALHTKDKGNEHTLKSMVSMYPNCQLTGVSETGSEKAEILVVIGSKDTYTNVELCEELVTTASSRGRRARLIVYEGAYHGFDGDKSATFNHGSLGTHTVRSNWEVTKRARKDVLNFLKAVGTSEGIPASKNTVTEGKKNEACKTPTYANMFPDACS